MLRDLASVLLLQFLGLATSTNPAELLFQRMATQRSILDGFGKQVISGPKLDPASSIPALAAMHPTVSWPTVADTPCNYTAGRRVVASNDGSVPSSSMMVVGGLPAPYGMLDLEIGAADAGTESGISLFTLDRAMAVTVFLENIDASGASSIRLRVKRGDNPDLNLVLLTVEEDVTFPFTLKVQLAGCAMVVFTEESRDPEPRFRARVDDLCTTAGVELRERALARRLKFGVWTSLPPSRSTEVSGARFYLGSGIGQADMRLVTNKDGTPFHDEGPEANRYWFTYSVRGLWLSGSMQGVMSVDPVQFDVRFEGAILYDRGDGLLRNDYVSHLVWDGDESIWRIVACAFSQSDEDRGPSGLTVATSKADPRRGLKVLSSKFLSGSKLPFGKHEDPMLMFDSGAQKWRLLATRLSPFRATLYESASWDGPFTVAGGPVSHDSTGTMILSSGSERYVLSGSSEQSLFVYSYPDLIELGQLEMDLPPWAEGMNTRVWPNVFAADTSADDGGPVFYAMMMDRANYPNVTGSQWSYGALYFYWAHLGSSGHLEV